MGVSPGQLYHMGKVLVEARGWFQQYGRSLVWGLGPQMAVTEKYLRLDKGSTSSFLSLLPSSDHLLTPY